MNAATGTENLLILIPAFNEVGAIGDVIQEVHQVAPDVPVLVVDDASNDGTVRSRYGRPALTFFACRITWAWAAACKPATSSPTNSAIEYVIRVDGDGQHDPRYIPDLLKVLRETGCHMVIGSRFYNGNGNAHQRGSGHGHLGVSAGACGRSWAAGARSDIRDSWVSTAKLCRYSASSFPLEYPEIEALVVLQRKRFRFQEVPCQMRAAQGWPQHHHRGKIAVLHHPRSAGCVREHFEIRTPSEERIAMERLLNAVTILSVVLIATVLFSVRRSHIRVEYSVSWLAAAVILLVLSRSDALLNWIAQRAGPDRSTAGPASVGLLRFRCCHLPSFGGDFRSEGRQHRHGPAARDRRVSVAEPE